MQIRLLFHDVIEGTASEASLQVTPTTTFAALLDAAGFPGGEFDLPRYYAVTDAYSANASVLPYLIVDGKVRWEGLYQDATARDAAATLQIRREPLHVRVGFPQAGGPDILDVVILWQRFYDAIRAIDPLVGVGGGVLGLVTFLRDFVRRRRRKVPAPLAAVPPGAVFSLVLRQSTWSSKELAEVASIAEVDAKHLLRLCRYQWDRGARRYRRTPQTARVVAALNAIDQYDD